jgi:integrase
MASRPRSTKRRGWPDGLYERGGYYSWRNPLTGKEMGIGRVTLGEAKAQASEANVEVAGLRDKPRLVDRLRGNADNTWRGWLVEYEKRIGLVESEAHDPPPLAYNTIKTYRTQVKKIREVWADSLDLPIGKVTTRILADGLKALRTKHARTAQSVRSRLSDSFDAAIAEGWTETNPVTVTDDIAVTVQRARLTWDVFKALYDSLEPGRLRNACALALVSGQARETVAAGEFAQVGMVTPPGQQPVECWCVTRGKTGAMIAIPLSLRLDVFGMSLRDVIRQCRATGVASKYLVHNHVRIKGARIGSGYHVDRLTKDFTAAMDALGLDWGDKSPPTFHELRSLSKRLYEQQGGVDTQELLGHKDEKTALLYANARGSEYRLVTVAAG